MVQQRQSRGKRRTSQSRTGVFSVDSRQIVQRHRAEHLRAGTKLAQALKESLRIRGCLREELRGGNPRQHSRRTAHARPFRAAEKEELVTDDRSACGVSELIA